MPPEKSYSRVRAIDVVKGDRVARARTHPFHEVVKVTGGEKSVTIVQRGGDPEYEWYIRPRKMALLWREDR